MRRAGNDQRKCKGEKKLAKQKNPAKKTGKVQEHPWRGRPKERPKKNDAKASPRKREKKDLQRKEKNTVKKLTRSQSTLKRNEKQKVEDRFKKKAKANARERGPEKKNKMHQRKFFRGRTMNRKPASKSRTKKIKCTMTMDNVVRP